MHMRIYADPRLPVAQRNDKVGGLTPHPLQLEKLIDLIGDFPAVVFDQRAADPPDRLGFHPIESYGKDRLLDRFRRKLEHFRRRVGKVEKTPGRGRRGAVLGAQAQDTRDENVKGAVGSFRHRGDDRLLPFGHFTAQNPYRAMYFRLFHRPGFLGVDYVD